ncbi:hypothetical protein HMPREF0765_4226 [Sphingobacterium spiritivorum ATCC 33300]|uniref:Uncharacterized protein n=1 Tax=Sphingobacterium spiritivorum ATCC 33300 TaxID=525372 RepID=C2G3S0_SPHSI|nr:hypothetical protein HMPREF0765_4226 [Sphingobacterium spiritivorum ATCC 33300]
MHGEVSDIQEGIRSFFVNVKSHIYFWTSTLLVYLKNNAEI